MYKEHLSDLVLNTFYLLSITVTPVTGAAICIFGARRSSRTLLAVGGAVATAPAFVAVTLFSFFPYGD